MSVNESAIVLVLAPDQTVVDSEDGNCRKSQFKHWQSLTQK